MLKVSNGLSLFNCGFAMALTFQDGKRLCCVVLEACVGVRGE